MKFLLNILFLVAMTCHAQTTLVFSTTNLPASTNAPIAVLAGASGQENIALELRAQTTNSSTANIIVNFSQMLSTDTADTTRTFQIGFPLNGTTESVLVTNISMLGVPRLKLNYVTNSGALTVTNFTINSFAKPIKIER